MKLYMLDTNIVSLAIRGDESILRRLASVPVSSLCISAITCGELLFGLKRKPEAHRIHRLTQEFLRRVEVLPFDERVAHDYGAFRAAVMAAGYGLSPLDMQIAAHAHSVDAVLVSRDRAFDCIPGLELESWLGS